MPPLTVAEIAKALGTVAEGDGEKQISGANSLEAAGPDELSFAGPSAKTQAAAASSQAGCLLVTSAFEATGRQPLIRVADPRIAFAQVLGFLYPVPEITPFTHPTALIAASARISAGCSIDCYATVGENAVIGEGCRIGAGSRIGDGAMIGEAATLHAGVILYPTVQVGSRVILHAGCVIGADGFGFVMSGDGYEKFPQVGTVVIEDDVEIGANSCVDRAALGTTRIGRGTKIDNLVHIAHNCQIGKHVVIAAQTGFAGGVTVGDYAVIGGQVGVGEKANIESRAVIGSGGGILSFATVKAGEPVWGTPARPLRQHLKGLANVGKIAELREEIRRIKQQLARES